MKRNEVVEKLELIYKMNADEISVNADLIKKVTNLAYCLIKQKTYNAKQIREKTFKEGQNYEKSKALEPVRKVWNG